MVSWESMCFMLINLHVKLLYMIYHKHRLAWNYSQWRIMENIKSNPNCTGYQRRKWKWVVGHILRKPVESIEWTTLGWNSQDAQSRSLPRKTWKRIVEVEVLKAGRPGRKLKHWQVKDPKGVISWEKLTLLVSMVLLKLYSRFPRNHYSIVAIFKKRS